jgi:pimeloyl-ACP methyl ester carboxylesterase
LKNTTPLTLDDEDPLVQAAKDAEQGLYDFYGIPVTHRRILIPKLGIQVRVTEAGQGNPVLIVPGNTGDSFPFAPLMAELTGRRILALNRPGGGLSEGFDHRSMNFRELAVETLSYVLDTYSIDSIPIIAHSMGGHWSLWFSMDKPKRVQSLSLLGVPGNVLNTCPPFALRLSSVPGLNRLLIKGITPRSTSRALRGLAFLGHAQQVLAELPEAMAQCYYRFQNLPHYAVSSLSLMEELNRLSGANPKYRIDREELEKVRQPVQLIWGDNDPFGSVTSGRSIAHALNAAFHVLSGGGHLPWLDDPAACGRLIREFLP